MLELNQIKAQYPPALQGYERALVREYLQYKILQAIFESPFASSLSFLGGTALRIVHGNQRFSEDIDLDNFGLSWEDFAEMMAAVKRSLELEGLLVENKMVSCQAFHCAIRFPELLAQLGLSPLYQEKILIQVDTAAQGYGYQPELRILNKFDVFTQIRVTPLTVLLAQKIFTAVNRPRPKGRDFYDITFLFGQTKPDFGFIQQKMGISDAGTLRTELLRRIESYDFSELAQDVAPFLISSEQVKRVLFFREFWQQAPLI